jgi:hypothetical protein
VHHFDRIFDGHDVQFRLRQLLQHGIERRRIAAARGAGHEDDAVRAGKKLLELRQVGG